MKKQLKRALSLVLTLTLLLGSISMLTVSTAAEEVSSVNNVWDGTIAEEYAGGTGSADDPYLVTTGTELRHVATAGAATAEAGLTVQYCYAIAKNFTSTVADGKGAIVGYIGGDAANATKTQIKNCYAITNEGSNF